MNGQKKCPPHASTHLVNQLETGLVLLALVRELDADRGEGRGGGGQDDSRRGGEGGSLCAWENVYTHRDRRRASTVILASSFTYRFEREKNPRDRDETWIDPRSIDRSIAGNLELDERCATRREVARSARVDRIGVNRPLRSVVVRGRGRRARCAEGRHSSARRGGRVSARDRVVRASSRAPATRTLFTAEARTVVEAFVDFTETFWAIALPTKEEVADMIADTTELQSDARALERARGRGRGGEGSMEGRDPRIDLEEKFSFNTVREIQMG